MIFGAGNRYDPYPPIAADADERVGRSHRRSAARLAASSFWLICAMPGVVTRGVLLARGDESKTRTVLLHERLIEPGLPLIRGCQREEPLFYNTPKELLASVINRH